MKNILYLFLLFRYSVSLAQPVIDWQVNLGGSNGDLPFSISQTADSGFILTGSSSSIDYDVTENHGITDCWLVKLNASGAIEWQKSFGGSYIDNGWDVSQTADHGYIMVGGVYSTDGDISAHYGPEFNSDYWVVKTDSMGELEWEKTYGGSMNDEPTSIRQTSDGGYIIGGNSKSNDFDVSGHIGLTDTSDYWILKIDATGNLLWERSLGGTDEDKCNEIIETADGNYLAVGSTASGDGDVSVSYGNGDVWIVKISADGDLLWEKTFGGSENEYATSVRETTDGGFLIAGSTKSDDIDVAVNYGIYDFWAIRLNASGDLQWQKSYGGSRADELFSVAESGDAGFIFCGTSSSSDGDVTLHYGPEIYPDIWVVKTDTSGDMQWQKTFGGSDIENRPDIISITDSTFVFAASSNSIDFDITSPLGNTDYWVVKLDSCSASVFYADQDEDGFGDPFIGTLSCSMPPDYVSDSTDCNDADPMIYPGAPELMNGYDDNCNMLIDEQVLLIDEEYIPLAVYPNPVTDMICVRYGANSTLQVYNIYGQKLFDHTLKAGEHTMNMETWPAGNYLFYLINADGTISTVTVVKQSP